MRERVGRVARGSGTAGRGHQGVLTFPRKIYTIPSMGEEEGYARGEYTSSIPQGGIYEQPHRYLQSYNPTQYKYLIIPIIVNVSDKSMVLKKGYLK